MPTTRERIDRLRSVAVSQGVIVSIPLLGLLELLEGIEALAVIPWPAPERDAARQNVARTLDLMERTAVRDLDTVEGRH